MSSPHDQFRFEAFYAEVRGRLLAQTYALTGDLVAAQKAVEESLVAAWHHWRKVARLEDPERWVRPRAWKQAQRRHSTRPWHREKGLDPEVAATLAALAALTTPGRKVLLLTHLTTLSMDQIATEAGITRARAEDDLRSATAQFALSRSVAGTAVRPCLDELAASTQGTRWPRVTILTRAGAARRRTRTAAGALVAVAALVLVGSLVTNTAGSRPDLGRTVAGARTETSASADPDGSVAEPTGTAAPDLGVPTPAALSDEQMLKAAQVSAVVPGSWDETRTSTNAGGDGRAFPCQKSRYADPDGQIALLRRFSTARTSSSAAGQIAEQSASEATARKAFDTSVGWYAGCTEPRIQLMSTRQVRGIGDEAMVFVLHDWDSGRSLVAGVARSGLLTTDTITLTPGAPLLEGTTQMLAASVASVCALPGAGQCNTGPRSAMVPVLPTGQAPELLSEVDLPPVRGVDEPWVGTDPKPAGLNVASTRCDDTDFTRRGVSRDRTRSFVIPTDRRLPARFGLTETVGAMPPTRGRSFVDRVRTSLASCAERDLGTKVHRVADVDTRSRDLTAWHVTVEISDQASVDYLMAIVRTGTAVAQIGFVPTPRVTMTDDAFVALAGRALERLKELPAPRA